MVLRLAEELDGNGGGYGKFPGITVKELEQKFDRLVEDGTHRSITAILRITREQLMTRADLGLNRRLVVVAGIILVVFVLANFVVPEAFIKPVQTGIAASSVAFAALLGGVWLTRKDAVRAKAQVDAIREISCDSLIAVVRNPNFKTKALDADQVRFLRDLIRQSGRKEPEIENLVRVSSD